MFVAISHYLISRRRWLYANRHKIILNVRVQNVVRTPVSKFYFMLLLFARKCKPTNNQPISERLMVAFHFDTYLYLCDVRTCASFIQKLQRFFQKKNVKSCILLQHRYDEDTVRICLLDMKHQKSV